jgi:hypothetical protein
MKTKPTAFESPLLANNGALPAMLDEQTLMVAAAFLKSAHLTKGRKREEAKIIWRRLHSTPELIAELQRKGLITEMPKAP